MTLIEPFVRLSRTRSKIRGSLAVVATALAVATGVLVAASPAAAATPACNDRSAWFSATNRHYLVVPVYRAANGVRYRGCLLRQGDGAGNGRKRAVVGLQSALNICNKYWSGSFLSLDGAFGPKTKAALVAAQRHYGLTADGVYGPRTADRLRFPVSAADPLNGAGCYSFY